MAPRRRARIVGSTALIRATGPKKLVANSFATSATSASSIADRYPYPALFTSTSTAPNRSSAAATAPATAVGSVTSSASGSVVSGWVALNSVSESRSRAVTTALSPRSST